MSTDNRKNSMDFREECAAYAGGLFECVRAMSRDGAGVTRTGYSEKELEVVDFLEHEGRELGLDVRRDKAGNVHMTLPGRDRRLPAFMSGSHADSVVMGGNYDGLAGVLAPLSAARWMVDNRVVPPRDFTVVVMRSEEQGCLGTLGAFGKLTPADLERRFAPEEPTLGELMTARGIDTAACCDGTTDPLFKRAAAFVELHIEQGPVLDAPSFERIGLVTGIVGIHMHRRITVKGVRAHAGAVPYEFRHDPVKAATLLIAELERAWEARLSEGKRLTYTVGMLNTPPKSGFNIIPKEITFSVDIRSEDAAVRDEFAALLQQTAHRIGSERGVTFEFDNPVVLAPSPADPDVFARLKAAAVKTGVPAKPLPSGAGHDAGVLQQAGGVPTAMIFVANQNGSHCPEETMRLADLAMGADIIRQTALDFA